MGLAPDSDVAPLSYQEMLALAGVWASAQASRGAAIPIMLLARDPAFEELCGEAFALGAERMPEHHWCEDECGHEDPDDVRAMGYVSALRELAELLARTPRRKVRRRVREWINDRLHEHEEE